MECFSETLSQNYLNEINDFEDNQILTDIPSIDCEIANPSTSNFELLKIETGFESGKSSPISTNCTNTSTNSSFQSSLLNLSQKFNEKNESKTKKRRNKINSKSLSNRHFKMISDSETDSEADLEAKKTEFNECQRVASLRDYDEKTVLNTTKTDFNQTLRIVPEKDLKTEFNECQRVAPLCDYDEKMDLNSISQIVLETNLKTEFNECRLVPPLRIVIGNSKQKQQKLSSNDNTLKFKPLNASSVVALNEMIIKEKSRLLKKRSKVKTNKFISNWRPLNPIGIKKRIQIEPDMPLVEKQCFEAIQHCADPDEIIKLGFCVRVCSAEAQENVGKILHFYYEPNSSNFIISFNLKKKLGIIDRILIVAHRLLFFNLGWAFIKDF